ncbi:hypothetical protein E4T56_gene11342 [Termitomyces sp. T112]|nr:hypothetical protein E4T56_gene11342 [Termitomyces sp. T112]
MGRTLDEDDKYGSKELESESSVKEWIRLLEKEIVRLKEELAKHPCLYTLHVEAPPPPPPLLSPPPPGSSAEMLFASAHAALKHIPILVEVPINPPHSTKCWEQPTVGIIPNKIFLQHFPKTQSIHIDSLMLWFLQMKVIADFIPTGISAEITDIQRAWSTTLQAVVRFRLLPNFMIRTSRKMCWTWIQNQSKQSESTVHIVILGLGL